jgi:hypothetical protein
VVLVADQVEDLVVSAEVRVVVEDRVVAGNHMVMIKNF